LKKRPEESIIDVNSKFNKRIDKTSAIFVISEALIIIITIAITDPSCNMQMSKIASGILITSAIFLPLTFWIIWLKFMSYLDKRTNEKIQDKIQELETELNLLKEYENNLK